MKVTDDLLRQLARRVASEPAVAASVSRFVEEKLTRQQRKQFVFFLRRETAARTVRVRTPDAPTAAQRDSFKRAYPAATVVYETVPALGAGFQIEYGDTLVNANIRRMLERTIEELKENL